MGSSCLGTLERTPLTQSSPQVLGPSLQGREWTLMDLDMELSLVRWGWGGWWSQDKDPTWSIPQVLDPKGPSEELTDMHLSTVHLGRQNGDIVTCRH